MAIKVGLEANYEKSSFSFVGVHRDMQVALAAIVGLFVAPCYFKYFGVPLASRKLKQNRYPARRRAANSSKIEQGSGELEHDNGELQGFPSELHGFPSSSKIGTQGISKLQGFDLPNSNPNPKVIDFQRFPAMLQGTRFRGISKLEGFPSRLHILSEPRARLQGTRFPSSRDFQVTFKS
ncbi:hypothetical protein Dimus_014560 [Dionaea muscipula]